MARPVEAEPVLLDPEALFFNLGLEGCTRKILRADRIMAFRLGRDMHDRASEFLVRVDPRRFIPRRPTVKTMRKFLESDLSDVNPELLPVVKQAQSFLSQLAPQDLTNDFVPLEFVAHSLELTKLRRAFSILERPRTLFGLVMMGGVLGDEVDALMGVIPEVYQLWLQSVVNAAIDYRTKSKRWQPSRQAKYQLPVLIGAGAVAIPEVADVFAAQKAQKQAQAQSEGADPTGGPDATPAQRKSAGLSSPRSAAR